MIRVELQKKSGNHQIKKIVIAGSQFYTYILHIN